MKYTTDYNHKDIEIKWQKEWAKTKVYSPDLTKADKPFYNLMMFPYPSAEGLHAGNMFAFTGSDIYGRFKRMQGFDVFEPIGLDGFGIHAENYALKIGKSPLDNSKLTEKNYYRQLHEIGNGFDWDHNLETYNSNYYHWTEWVFLELFKAGLAYRKKAVVNFCPKDKTVLSDEQVMTPKQAEKEPIDAQGNPVPLVEGLMVCERCGTIIEKKELDVWFFRITDYAERLLNGLDKINWSERVKIAQKDWVGKAKGLNIDFKIESSNLKITVWTKFWETIFGTTYLVLSPEHPLVEELSYKSNDRKNFMNRISKLIAIQKKQDNLKNNNKTGFFSGSYAVNPVNNAKIPIWIGDYVLTNVGTGAVMGVPAHDTRDFDFAKKYHLDIVQVVEYPDKNINKKVTDKEISYEGEGKLINSGKFNGMDAWSNGKEKMAIWMIRESFANWSTTYHLRDWGIGRQRYWGCPIPMIYCKRCAEKGEGYLTSKGNKVLHKDQTDWSSQGWWPEENLPVELPVIKDYKPEGNGRGPLANHPEFYEVKCPHCGADAKRETDVADTFLDSSWYFFRYPSTGDKTCAWSPELTKKWLPVNQYFGGAEHAVLHLMYARFITMVFKDLNLISHFEEPFPNFFAHGLLIKDGAKMSKSRGNVVNPDDYIKKFGADTLRTYLMFIGPMDSTMDFRDTGIEGANRFLKRIWNLYQEAKPSKDDKDLVIKTHQTIQKVTKDIGVFHYNTAISAIMEFVNFLKDNGTTKESLEVLCQLIAPFAPHIAEELWVNVLKNKYSVHTSKWPQYNSKYIKVSTITIIVQVDGKMRSQIIVDSVDSSNNKKIEALTLKDEKIQKWLNAGKYKVIFVPGKIINFVLS